jgi:hypothetical protein
MRVIKSVQQSLRESESESWQLSTRGMIESRCPQTEARIGEAARAERSIDW